FMDLALQPFLELVQHELLSLSICALQYSYLRRRGLGRRHGIAVVNRGTRGEDSAGEFSKLSRPLLHRRCRDECQPLPLPAQHVRSPVAGPVALRTQGLKPYRTVQVHVPRLPFLASVHYRLICDGMYEIHAKLLKTYR